MVNSKFKIYYAFAYYYLSKNDGDKGESNSIINQRKLVSEFVPVSDDIQLAGECYDDGYTGKNFDCPGFQKMLMLIKQQIRFFYAAIRGICRMVHWSFIGNIWTKWSRYRMNDDNKLGQAKKRDMKVKITEIAIEKVPYVSYKGFTEEQNKIVYSLAKEVLRLSKENNDSNEVAITCCLKDDSTDVYYGVAYGDEHSVNVLADTDSYHIIMSEQDVTVVMLHNHPSTQTFSIEDLMFMLFYANIKVLVLVSNQGVLHYLLKDNNYDEVAAKRFVVSYATKIRSTKDIHVIYEITLDMLRNCGEIGLIYR